MTCDKCKAPIKSLHMSGMCKACREITCECGKKFTRRIDGSEYCSECAGVLRNTNRYVRRRRHV